MTRTHQTIAQQLRNRIGSHYTLLCSKPVHELTDAEYQAARADSDQALSMARYLARHLAGINRAAFCAACGIRES